MTAIALNPREAATGDAPVARARHEEDKAMLRAAAELTRDLHRPRADIYWPDLLASVLLGYAGLAGAILLAQPWAAIACAVVAVFALYRAESFIHELTHLKHSELPGFRLGWNLLVGIPLMVPSFMYEGVHTLHHARTRYGTVQDPEYLPLALMKPHSVPLFLVAALFAPVALLFRFAVITPLSLLLPGVRSLATARFSALAINPAFRRTAPEGALKRQWLAQELATSAWAIALIAMVATGVLPLKALLIFLGVGALVAFINQVRTLVAHLWENDGEPMSVTAQYLDSVNVPPPGALPYLWAPVGLRFHALHHLLPGLPYHSLGEAHRRIAAAVGADSAFHGANHPGLLVMLGRLIRSTMAPRSRG